MLVRLVVAASIVSAGSLRAQDTAITRLLLANRHPIALNGGRLVGAGGRHLVEQARSARFVLLGEEHGVAEVPRAMGALLRELRPAGFHTLAIEVSPSRGRELDGMARGARTPAELAARLDSSLASWRTAVPFYTLTEEREMLRDALTPQDRLPPMRVLGLDYEVSADRQYLEELERLAPPSGRSAVRAARGLADSGFARLVRAGDPSGLFAFSAPESVFTALRTAMGPRPPARAEEIVSLLQRTARINRLFVAGRGYESNQERSRFLRENFTRARASTLGATDRVVFKFGGDHMMRGWNYTHALDLGTAAAMLAEEQGGTSYHVLLMGGSGTRSSRMNIVKAQYEPIGTAEVDGPMLAWLAPALPDSGWVLFDVKAVRTAAMQLGRPLRLLPIQDRFLHAYDAIVVFTGSHPGGIRPLRTTP